MKTRTFLFCVRWLSVCGIAVPLNLLEVRINEGDTVTAEIIKPELRREIKWVDLE